MPTSSSTPAPVRRALTELGTSLAAWRKLQGLTAGQVAERAGLSRGTLRRLEQGEGGASVESLVRVLRSLGILQQVVESVDPYSSDVGRLRSDEILPQRVRRPTTLRTDNG